MQSSWSSQGAVTESDGRQDGPAPPAPVVAAGVAGPEARRQPTPQPRAARTAHNARQPQSTILPLAPGTLEETGLSTTEIEGLILKLLLNRGQLTGREVAEQIKLPFGLIDGLLRQSKEDQMVVYKGVSAVGDYHYELTELGSQRARRYAAQCAYCDAAPVTLSQYAAGIEAQSVTKERPRLDELRRAMADLLLDEDILCQLGQSVSAGRGLFLYGSPGNGKTSIAERVCRAFGETVWIPRAITVQGEIIRIYDPVNHEAMPLTAANRSIDQTRIDHRWIRVRRPTIVAGGELTMDNLEIDHHPATGIGEAPLQLKANGGVLVIDDFGRQRVSPAELLNRWIVPLEKRYDYLNLGHGLKIQVPFDQLIIFSTNLQPSSLVDEAFLRRIPYKIDVRDPSESEFRQLFEHLARAMGITLEPGTLDHLISCHYRKTGRPMRFCHPRDILHQIRTYCDFYERPMAATCQAVDAAVRNYFAIM